MDTIRLNLGAGSSRIPGYLSVDVESSVKPDVVCNFTKDRLPYKDNEVQEILFFHTIEHIERKYHKFILSEIHRVLRSDGILLISYPEFSEIVQNWLDNKNGQREFWEHTVYGLQRYPSDFHVVAMHTPHFKLLLEELGFRNVGITVEPQETYNTIIKAWKGIPFVNYEKLAATPTTIVHEKVSRRGKGWKRKGVSA